ncbi:MAG: hypothetical protein Q9209_005044 [Squamulea sp. 1 TL-2023]
MSVLLPSTPSFVQCAQADCSKRDEYDERLIRYHYGWRSVALRGMTRFREYLISSPHQLEEHADILPPENEVRCVGFIEVILNEMERSGFPALENKILHKLYSYFQYEVRFTMGYLFRHFEVVIPRSGVFPKDWRRIPGRNGEDDDARLGPDPIRKSVPILRHNDRKDIEEDPMTIYSFQNEEFEQLRASQARSPDHHKSADLSGNQPENEQHPQV